jgi:hypothetical protein
VKGAYPHHSSFEVDNMDSQLIGHNHLELEEWTNCWGIGRHIFASQIFDYWYVGYSAPLDCSASGAGINIKCRFDAFGNVVEHYSDGDVVNNKNGY